MIVHHVARLKKFLALGLQGLGCSPAFLNLASNWSLAQAWGLLHPHGENRARNIVPAEFDGNVDYPSPGNEVHKSYADVGPHLHQCEPLAGQILFPFQPGMSFGG